MINIAPSDIGFGFVDYLTVIAIISIYYLKWKGHSNVIYASYVFLSMWIGMLEIPFAVAWNRSWPFIGDVLILLFFGGCRIVQIILLALAIKPAIVTAITIKDGVEK